MWYGVQNMSKYDIDIKVQPLWRFLSFLISDHLGLNSIKGGLILEHVCPEPGRPLHGQTSGSAPVTEGVRIVA